MIVGFKYYSSRVTTVNPDDSIISMIIYNISTICIEATGEGNIRKFHPILILRKIIVVTILQFKMIGLYGTKSGEAPC